MKLMVGVASMLLLASPWVWAESGMQEQPKFPFSFEPVAGKKVSIEQPKGGDVFAHVQGGKPQLLGMVETYVPDDHVTHIAVTGDMNFDGARDLGILEGIGYGGVNLFYRVFLWDKKTNTFKEQPEPIGNPVLEAAQQQLVSSQRSGPKWYTTTFRVHNGLLYPAIEQEMAGTSGDWDVLVFKNPAGKVTGRKVIASGDNLGKVAEDMPAPTTQVRIKKAWLHDQPNEASKTKMYLVKKDKVTLLDWQATEGDAYSSEGWFLVHYEGKKVLEKWVDGSAFVKP